MTTTAVPSRKPGATRKPAPTQPGQGSLTSRRIDHNDLFTDGRIGFALKEQLPLRGIGGNLPHN